MAKNLVRKTFLGDGSWTCPAGVTSIRAVVETPLYSQLVGGKGNNAGMVDRQTGTVYMWGLNSTGELGDNTITARSSPVAVVGARTARNVASGIAVAGFIGNDGNAYTMGGSNSGALGDNTNSTARSSPVAVVGINSYKQIEFGRHFGVALLTSGAAVAWGANDNGNLGDNTTSARSSPVAVVGGHVFQKIACAFNGDGTNGHVLGLKTDGSVMAWGLNASGQLGDGTTAKRSSPVAVLGAHKFIDIACGESHSVGLKADGTVMTWGRNTTGELGDGTVVSKSSPVAVIGPSTRLFRRITAGERHTLMLDNDGSAWGVGAQANAVNVSGSLGDGTTTDRSSPVAVIGAHKFAAIQGTRTGAIAVRQDGQAMAWGLNSDGIVGDNTTTGRSSPVAVVGLIRPRCATNVEANRTVIPVTPGVTYPIVVSSPLVSFGGVGVFDNVSQNPYLVLEYFT